MTKRDSYTVAEVAEMLGITPRGVAYRLEGGQMHGIKVNARLWLVPAAEVEKWKPRGKVRAGRPRTPRTDGNGNGDGEVGREGRSA